MSLFAITLRENALDPLSYFQLSQPPTYLHREGVNPLFFIQKSFMYACSVAHIQHITESYLTLWDPMDCSPPESSVYEIFQAEILEWVAISYCRGSTGPKDGIQSLVSPALACRLFTTSTTWEALKNIYKIRHIWVWQFSPILFKQHLICVFVC